MYTSKIGQCIFLYILFLSSCSPVLQQDDSEPSKTTQEVNEAPAASIWKKAQASNVLETFPDRFMTTPCARLFSRETSDLKGIDLSVYQGDVDWPILNASSHHFIFIRATYGASVDPNFIVNWRGAARGCLLRAPYLFFVASEAPAKQVDALVQALSMANAGTPELPPVIDIERLSTKISPCKNALTAKRLADRLTILLKIAEEKFNRKAMIYTSLDFWRCLAAHNDFTSANPLWIAEYADTEMPSVPAPWTTWHFWQYTDVSTAPGIKGHVDANKFNGTPHDLLLFSRKTF